MNTAQRRRWIFLLVFVLATLGGVAGIWSARQVGEADDPVGDAQVEEHDPEYVAWLAEHRDPDVPDLPFPDNPDPSQCGIPTAWGKDQSAWLTGFYAGELVQADVLLYESHSRLKITASAPHGAEVKIVLFQANPVTDYYMVKIVGADGASLGEGWVPEPFLSFEPVAPLTDGA